MPRMRQGRDETTGRFVKGNRESMRHAGYSHNSRNIPARVRRQVEALREALVRDLAGEPGNLTAAQVILIDKTMNLYQITLCLEAYIRREGPFRGKKLDPVLGQHYVTYVNTIRLNLRELGISRKAGEQVLTPLELAAVIDREKAREGPGSAQEGRTADDEAEGTP
jgi:hypothetical protein